MRGVRRQLDVDDLPGAGGELPGLAEVVLHIPRTLDGVGVDPSLELLEELADLLADDVHEHIEASAMRHSHDRTLQLAVGRAFEEGVEYGNGRLGAFEPESLLAEVLRGEEFLECFGGVQAIEDVGLVGSVELGRAALDLLLYPALLLDRLDVGVLDSDGSAVGVAQHAQNPPQLHALLSSDGRVDPLGDAGQEFAIEVPDRQSVGRRIEFGMHLG